MEVRQQARERSPRDRTRGRFLKVRESPFVLLTNIYCVPTYMSDTVLGPDDIVVTKTKCLL